MKKDRSHKEVFGWGLSIILSLPLLWGSYAGMAGMESASMGFMGFGYSESAVMPIASVLLISVILYLLPYTAYATVGLGLLVAYFGGAVATHLISGAGSPIAPVAFGILLAVGLCLRNERFSALFDRKKGQ